MYSLEELKKGNVEILSTMTYSDTHDIVDLIHNCPDKKQILHTILPCFENKGDYFGIAYDLFRLIYLDSEFKEHTFYLLHHEYIRPQDILVEEINHLLDTSWGLDYIFHNLEAILMQDDFSKKTCVIVKFIKDKSEIYQQFLGKFLTLSNQDIRDRFIRTLFQEKVDFDLNIILRSFYKNPDEFDYQQESLPFYQEEKNLVFSKLPKFLLFYSKIYPELKKMILENFEIFFQTELCYKMELLENFYTEPLFWYHYSNLLSQYRELLCLYLKQPTLDIDRILTTLINYHQEKSVIDILKNQEIKYLSSGTTTRVFQVGNKVLKFSLKKHELATEKDLFLIAPTETEIIYDENNAPVLIVEIQDYLKKEYNGLSMTDKDIEHFFQELSHQGYILTDPNCLEKNNKNFGFLNDYHDANITGFQSAEDLPERFKKRPIVLYDVDLVYKKDAKKVKRFGGIYE